MGLGRLRQAALLTLTWRHDAGVLCPRTRTEAGLGRFGAVRGGLGRFAPA